MDSLRGILLSSEPLILFGVIGLGFMLGQIRVRGVSLGVAGVLFAGLAIGGWRPDGAEPFAIAHQVTQVGLILFVYAIGLTSGPGFFASLRKRGLRFNAAVLASLLIGAATTLALGGLLGLTAGQVAGVFCGGLTNTPALAAVTELMTGNTLGDASDPAVGYSMAYPFGVIGGLLAFEIFARLNRTAVEDERAAAEAEAGETTRPSSANFKVTNSALCGKAIGELRVQEATGLIVSRLRHGNEVVIPTKYTHLEQGDVVVAVGPEVALGGGVSYFGERSDDHLELAPAPISMRRILVSRKELVGRTLDSLDLDRRFNAQITRLRRADIDLAATPDMQLELGDRLRVVMPSSRKADVAKFFGDSERGASELDFTALTLGISAGVLLGLVPIPIPGGTSVSLGFAGGPLVAGLVLGRFSRTGPLVWSIPLEANHALRHIGLLFFLAGVGVMAGGRFFEALSGEGLAMVGLGFVTTALTTALTLLALRHLGKASVVSTIGATSGMQTQPATLARAYEMSGSDETYVAYATTYPVAMVGKILIAQLLVVIAVALGLD